MANRRNRPIVEPFLWWLILPGIGLGAAGFLAAEQYDQDHLLTTKLISVGLTELGFAFLISAIVYRLFEEAMKRDEAKGIAAFLYGIRTDSYYFKMIEDYIIRCPFYRYDTSIIYRFTEKQGESYLIDYIIEYHVINVSKVAQKFQVTGTVETRSIHDDVDQVQCELGIVGAEVLIGEEKIVPTFSYDQGKSSPHAKTFASEPFRLGAGEGLRVKLHHKIAKHDHDTDVWQAVIPCSGVKLRLEWRKEWGLRFTHEAFHPNADDLEVNENCDDSICWKELDLQQPFMARHGFHFSWTKPADGRRGRDGDRSATEALPAGSE